jgi:hypothetical protein
VESSGSLTIKDFHELKVWQKAHQWTLAIYQTTAMFPREELYGLTSQLRRYISSIPANLAEGCLRLPQSAHNPLHQSPPDHISTNVSAPAPACADAAPLTVH